MLSILAIAAVAGSVRAAPWTNEHGLIERDQTSASSWSNQWQPDANGVVHYGFNATFNQGYWNASQIRTAYRGCNGMSVSWSTNGRNVVPTVLYGTSNSSLNWTATSSVSITYETSLKWENHVVLENLEPNTKYYYSVCGSPVNSFTTARCAGDMTPYTAAVVVDMGAMGEYGLRHNLPSDISNPIPANQTNTIQRLVAQMDDYEFVVHPGDMAYADYWVKEQVTHGSNLTLTDQVLGYNAINDAFFNEVAEVASKKAYMVGVGNHEANCINGGYKQYPEAICTAGLTNFTEYKVRWNMPGDGSASNNFWYSFDVGMAHYLIFDTETDLPPPYYGADVIGGVAGMYESNVGAYPTAQVDFIKQDLASVNRTQTPWVIAMGHRPWYVSAAPEDRFMSGLAVFEPLFEAANVDVVMQGHVHLISRSYPVHQNGTVQQYNYTEPQAPVYLVNGAAGHYDGLDKEYTPLYDYIAFANDTMYSYSKLTFHNSTHLTHQFMASGDNSVIDAITIEKTH
ncbi:Metallo-dependent phosphatase-like protein [Kockovaella imperatae]|uniref:Purple acid phosphatase n=1 Tax=Kockovaella imperatae TaxID=4999 RepID=A0A1Y1UMI4_9TREE|nr:Metallo-dependent phosphatase-like protein [Kockovaella imperatae]ORX38727.1 Metallo-dependent phosphatase-like protein [Kockovaella imperatae]